LGRTVVVTAAEDGWVQGMCQKFMPQLLPLLEGKTAVVEVVSARSEWEHHGYPTAFEWKRMAFGDLLQDQFGGRDRLTNVLSVGDALYEQEALRSVTEDTKAHAKSVKLVAGPSMAVLRREVSFLSEVLPALVTHPDTLWLAVEVDPFLRPRFLGPDWRQRRCCFPPRRVFAEQLPLAQTVV